MSKPKDLSNLIQLTKTTQALLTHYTSSLAAPSSNKANSDIASSSSSQSEISDPLSLLKSSTTLLKSHTTTLSLLLINPPFTSSAIASKIGDISSGSLSGMVVAASYVPTTEQSKNEGAGGGDVGAIMRSEMRAQVKSILGCWSEVLNLVCRIAEEKQTQLVVAAGAKGGKVTVTEAEKQQVLSTTGVVWDACDALVKLCDEGVVGLVVKKAEEYRAVLLDAIEELKEWGEDVDEDDDEAEGSDEEEDDEDDLFGKEKKIKKDDKEMKALLDLSVKKLKMVGMLYQALIKRRLKTYPSTTLTPPPSSSTTTTTPSTTTEGEDKKEEVQKTPSETLNALMHTLKSIPETVDDIAAAFYDLDGDEAKQTLAKCCDEAKKAIELVRGNWETGKEDEFSAWGAKWIAALDAIST